MMQVLNELEPLNTNSRTILTIGNFDGVHLGHQKVLQKAASFIEPSTLITFENHPREVLHQKEPIQTLCTLPHKLKLIEEQGIDTVFLLPFTKAFSEQSAEAFLKAIYQETPFSHLILGYDAKFGKDRSGDQETIKKIAKKLGFEVEYIPPLLFDGSALSSSKIRKEIREGNIEKASRMLGRPYSIYSTVIKGRGQGKRIGYPTANIEVENLCLPPLGVWAITAKHQGKTYSGIANLGIAPTIREDGHPLLEVHLFDHEPMLYHEEVEIVFHTFIRSEIAFSSLDELKKQIAEDVNTVKNLP